jgi:hypothetical protein
MLYIKVIAWRRDYIDICYVNKKTTTVLWQHIKIDMFCDEF